MKKVLLIAVAFLGLQATAQQQNRERPNRERMERMSDYTPEEMAELQTKKMTLHLDLTEAQQSKIYDINLTNAPVRKAKMTAMKAKKESGDFVKPTKEERLAMVNAKLDRQIEMKKKMKSILNDEQYAKWEIAQAKMSQRGKKGKRKHKGMKKQ